MAKEPDDLRQQRLRHAFIVNEILEARDIQGFLASLDGDADFLSDSGVEENQESILKSSWTAIQSTVGAFVTASDSTPPSSRELANYDHMITVDNVGRRRGLLLNANATNLMETQGNASLIATLNALLQNEKNRIEVDKKRVENEKGRIELEKGRIELEKKRLENEKGRIELESKQVDANKEVTLKHLELEFKERSDNAIRHAQQLKEAEERHAQRLKEAEERHAQQLKENAELDFKRLKENNDMILAMCGKKRLRTEETDTPHQLNRAPDSSFRTAATSTSSVSPAPFAGSMINSTTVMAELPDSTMPSAASMAPNVAAPPTTAVSAASIVRSAASASAPTIPPAAFMDHSGVSSAPIAASAAYNLAAPPSCSISADSEVRSVAAPPASTMHPDPAASLNQVWPTGSLATFPADPIDDDCTSTSTRKTKRARYEILFVNT